jgi:hypothetical protein
MAPLARNGLRQTNRAPVFVFCAWVAMHAPLCFGKFPYSVGKFSKATPVLESCYVVFWKVFKIYTGLGKLLRGVLESFQKLHAACLNTGFVFFFRRW